MTREIVLAAAYFLGSIPFAFLIVKAAGRGDVRTVGSGNVGATNAMRVAGWKVALPVALLDIGKGVAAVMLMRSVTANPSWVAAAGLAAIVGHCFPVWLGFAGGKGVATAAGVFLTFAWQPMLAVAAVWMAVLLLFRIVSARQRHRSGCVAGGDRSDRRAAVAGGGLRRRCGAGDHLARRRPTVRRLAAGDDQELGRGKR